MIELLLNGLFVGALYSLFGLGLAVTFGLMQQINLAHGDMIVLSAYLAWLATQALGINPLFSLPFVALLMFAFGYALQRVVLNRTIGRGPMPTLLVTFGLSIVLQNMMQIGFSADTRSLQPGSIGSAALPLGSFSIGVMPLFFFLFACLAFACTWLVFAKTSFGRAVRATSDDHRTARLMGIETGHIFSLALAISLSVSAIAAIFLGMRSTFAPAAGPERMLFAFEAVILGGLGSIWGTFFGGLALGLAQAIGLAIAPTFGPLAGHLVFLAVLLFRPAGMFARRNGL
ncbi:MULTISPECIES: branched-chain amino acid ABC transporter permease [Stappiaceae]|jgi:branched-chain amino acid transport system permease protein|uniref:ABC transporter permease protein n=1 Tax=Roseibium aggregatum (strain ATCC 25650 / DSM 13394 / JCM 20685 / NBRC 16684 / NCIMB 2208 / IAM 12614 / B1) TaxID=384765 RepID=A0P006_ROSAI|nr:branched-chain amino acid ABC transporter permease [Roseibium aggregatum]EAV41723.1 ABC transporter permease protein [Stappia aggregata IAM 12614] [Roseibium aggregatum IAM 12614]